MLLVLSLVVAVTGSGLVAAAPLGPVEYVDLGIKINKHWLN
jgi:hypothetical protein